MQDGHFVYSVVRNHNRLHIPDGYENQYQIIEANFLDQLTLNNIPKDIDAAYYLIHSMAQDAHDFDIKDRIAADNFVEVMEKTNCKQIIYLSGIVNDTNLSKHLNSRYEVEKILSKSHIPLTCLRAAIIIGSGSASFEIIRDLVEKLPIMIAPKWLKSKCQPIGIADVIDYLAKVLNEPRCFGKAFDIGGPDKLSYKEMLLQFAEIRHLKRKIWIVPVLTPKLSSHWLFFITSTSHSLAKALVDSLKNDAVCKNEEIQKIIPKTCLTYKQAVEKAFQKIEDDDVVSSWKDSWSSTDMPAKYYQFVQVPTFGCLHYIASQNFDLNLDPQLVMNAFYKMGGKNGYYVNWAWKIRGFIDRLLGGVGLRRGKVRRKKPRVGDALDFWRVLLVDEQNKRFLLYAEMKLPGEAWLEFSLHDHTLIVHATFRPTGVLGRLYWYSLWPIHLIIFTGLAKRIIKEAHNKI